MLSLLSKQEKIQAIERFESKYIKYSNSCWSWTGALVTGYGGFSFNGKTVMAHRFSWMLYRGKIPEGMLVLHKCNHKYCVNPEHLYIGDYSDNLQDSIDAGRPYGLRKLTVDNVICIKKMLRDGIKQQLIAQIYEVTRENISRISTGRIWKHINV